MSYSVDQLRSLPIEHLIAEHDRLAINTSPGVDYYLNEISRRDSVAFAEEVAANTEKVAEEVVALARLTEASGRRMLLLTYVIAVLTAANLAGVVLAT